MKIDKLDLQSILKRNPQIDATEIDEFLSSGVEGLSERSRGSSSPYDGRRMLIDDREDVEIIRKKRISGYEKA